MTKQISHYGNSVKKKKKKKKKTLKDTKKPKRKRTKHIYAHLSPIMYFFLFLLPHSAKYSEFQISRSIYVSLHNHASSMKMSYMKKH